MPLFGPKSGFEPVTCGLVTRKSDLYNMQAHSTFGNISFGTSRSVCKLPDGFWYIKVFYPTNIVEHNLEGPWMPRPVLRDMDPRACIILCKHARDKNHVVACERAGAVT